MNKELQNKLYAKYPVIFSQKDLSMAESCMFWGIDCGDGWYDIIDKLCQELSDISAQYDISVIADQVKEKYGTLRFYNHIVLGKRWTLKPARMARLLYKIVSYVPYKIFMGLHRYVTSVYRNACDKEYLLDNNVYITERRGFWVRHGNFMIAYRGVNNLVDDTINKFEDFSSMTCEICGSTVDVKSTQGWIKYLCSVCMDKRNNEQN